MRQHLFLHYGQFLQNLKKGFIQTNMHTTVIHKSTVFFTQSSSHVPTDPIRSGAPAMSGQQASFAVLFKVCMHLLNVLNQFCQLYIHASSMFAYSNSFFIQKFSLVHLMKTKNAGRLRHLRSLLNGRYRMLFSMYVYCTLIESPNLIQLAQQILFPLLIYLSLCFKAVKGNRLHLTYLLFK